MANRQESNGVARPALSVVYGSSAWPAVRLNASAVRLSKRSRCDRCTVAARVFESRDEVQAEGLDWQVYCRTKASRVRYRYRSLTSDQQTVKIRTG